MPGNRRARSSGKTKTFERIASSIRDSVLSGELGPGDRLPPETELARRFGVSRPTLREALKALEALDVLESFTGPSGGTFVSTPDSFGIADHLTSSLVLLFGAEKVSLEELWVARETIEVRAGELAAGRRTERDLEAMLGVIEEDEGKDYASYFPDITFHRTIAEASHNRLLSLFMLAVHMTLASIARDYVIPDAKELSQRQHRLIYEAILLKDGALARRRIQEHLEMAYSVYQRAVRRRSGELAARG